jgi:hypothetical protein
MWCQSRCAWDHLSAHAAVRRTIYKGKRALTISTNHNRFFKAGLNHILTFFCNTEQHRRPRW